MCMYIRIECVGVGSRGGRVLGRVLGGHLYDLYDCDYGAVQATAGVIYAGNRSTRWVASLYYVIITKYPLYSLLYNTF